MRSIKEFNRALFRLGDGIEVRPAGGFGTCPAFDSTTDISTQLRATYEATMPELYFGARPLPTWEEISAGRVTEQHAPDRLLPAAMLSPLATASSTRSDRTRSWSPSSRATGSPISSTPPSTRPPTSRTLV